MPGTEERLSHGEPTFFVKKKVFAACSTNHHNDGHVAVLIPAPPGLQENLVSTFPKVYYRPPYVGGKGWIGIELSQIDDEDLAVHLHEAWLLISVKKPSAKR